jgi:hypothetical protein
MFLLPQTRAEITLAQFEEKLSGKGRWLTSWKINDCWSEPAQIKDSPEARRVGVVFMDLGVAPELKHTWLQVHDAWYWVDR